MPNEISPFWKLSLISSIFPSYRILPFYIMATLVQRYSASSNLWVVNKTDSPQLFTSSKRFLLATGSNPTVGSSKNESSGPVSKVNPVHNFLLFPPLRMLGYLYGKSNSSFYVKHLNLFWYWLLPWINEIILKCSSIEINGHNMSCYAVILMPSR